MVSYGVRKVSHNFRKVSHGARKVLHGARNLSNGAREVLYGVRKVSHGARKVFSRNLSELRCLYTLPPRLNDRSKDKITKYIVRSQMGEFD